MPAPVVIGVDGSPAGQAALDWAIGEAVRAHRPLHLLHAWTWLPYGTVATPLALAGSADLAAEAAEETLRLALRQAETGAPEIEITRELVADGAGRALVAASTTAALLVVGARGLGGLAGQLLGSVSLYVAARAHCPVVVVRRSEPEAAAAADPRSPVVLGLDLLDPSAEATRFAFDWAAGHGRPLHAVYAWSHPVTEPRQPPPVLVELLRDQDATAAQARASLEHWLVPWQEEYPQVPVRRQVVRDAAAHTLVAASAGASLTVLGARRAHPHVPGLALGLTNHAVLHHVRTPVAIVPTMSRTQP